MKKPEGIEPSGFRVLVQSLAAIGSDLSRSQLLEFFGTQIR